MCDTRAPVPVVPSPNAHAQDAIVPSLSADVEPSRLATRSCDVEVNAAAGSRLGSTTLTVLTVVEVRPPPSVTVRPT